MLIYVALMGLTTFMILRHPGVAAGVLLCTYGLEQWVEAKATWFYTHGTVTNYVTGLLTVLAVIVSLIRGRPVLKNLPREYWLMAAIYFWALLSLMWDIDPDKGWANYSHNAPFFLLFGFLAPLVILDRSDLKAMLLTLLTLGFTICTLLLATTEWNERSIVLETGSIFAGDENSLGNPLAIAQLGSEVALAALLINFRGAARFWQVLRYVVFAVGFAVSVKSGSRGQALALVMLVLACFPLARRFKDVKGFIGFSVSLVALGTIGMMIFTGLTAKSLGPDRWSYDSFVEAYTDGRVATSLTVLARWAEGGPLRWIVGIGSSGSYKVLSIYPHVVLVEVLAELGFVGIVIFLAYNIVSIRTMKTLWNYVRDNDEDRGLIVALGAIYLFEILMSFKQGALLSSGTMFAMGISMARMLTFYKAEVAHYEQLDAGGYAMSDDEREHELHDFDDLDDAYPTLEPAHA